MSTARSPEAEEPACWSVVAAGDERERQRIHAVNRILLYARGLDLDAETGLRLASECLRRAGDAADLETILTHMHDILAERGVRNVVDGVGGVPLASMPPIHRTSMTATGIDCRSFLVWIWHGIQRICRTARLRKTTWKQQQQEQTTRI